LTLIAGVALASPSPAAAHTAPVLQLPVVDGAPTVGARVAGSAQATGEPAPMIGYH